MDSASETAAPAILLLMLMGWFVLKHFICDFALQTNYQAQNKGRYGHPAGLIHVGLHGVGTAIGLALLGFALAPIAGLVAAELVIHYHIDWGKQAVSTRAGWTPANRAFWVAIGADQFLHQITYLGMSVVALHVAP